MKDKIKKKSAIGRLSVVFAVSIAMLMPSAATAIGISLALDHQTLFPENRMTYTFEFKEPTLEALNGNGATYTLVSMSGCMAIGRQTGDPVMPVKTVQLLIPPKKAVSAMSVTGTPIVVPLTNNNLIQNPVFPQQPSVPIGSDILPEFTLNSVIYSTNAAFPTTQYSDYAVGYSHGYSILSFSLNPMQYNPVQGTLTYYPRMTVTITLNDQNSVNQFYSNNPSDEAYVKTLVSNPEVANLYTTADLPKFEYPGGLCDPSQKFDYVIVTTTTHGLDHWDIGGSLAYNWDSLIEKHAGDGLAGTVVTVQAINSCTDYQNSDSLFNDQQAHIREFCKDAYEDWGTRYVLIAGDSDTIGARQFYYASEGGFDSDVYWSNLDNNFNADHDSQWGEQGDSGYDLYAEIFIGRVTCDVPQDVSNWLTKCFYYADSMDYDYLNNAAFYGGALGFPGIGGDDFIDFSAIKGTSNWLGPDPNYAGVYPTWLGFQYGFETWNEVNPGNQFDLSVKVTDESSPNPGWSPGGPSAFRTFINNDQVTLISAIAHANEHMSMDVYDTDWESSYHNTMPFFVTDYGCHCGDFDAADDGVIEAMLFHSDTYLAFACVYNTAYGWGQFYCTNSSSALQQKSFWDFLFDTENNSGGYGNWQLGRGHAWSKDNMAPTINWDPGDETWRGTIGCCTLFGDPAQTLKTPSPSDPPLKPSKPVGKTLAIWNRDYSYTSSTTDPNGDQIYYLFDWGDGSTSGWLGPFASGQTATGTHSWTVLGEYSIKVKAHDVWGAASPASDPLSVTVTDNTPPFDPTIDGPTSIKPHISYTFTINGTDEFDQDLTYDVDWGDGNGGTGLGPVHSGQPLLLNHTWSAKGSYTIKARAVDTFGATSNWTTLAIAVPFDYQFSLSTFLQHLFERFPQIFPILRQLLGY